MGSKVVVTYKRKRLFSRSDHSPINLHSDKSSEISDSKSSANFDNHEESIAEHALQNKDSKFGTCHECSKDRVEENMIQSENCDSQYCGQFSEKQANKLRRLCSACTKQQNSSVSNQTEKPILEQKTHSQESHVRQITFLPNVPLEGSPEERCQFDSAGQSNAEENEDKCKDTCSNEDKCKETSLISPTPDVFSGIESDVLSLKTSDEINCSRQMKDTSISGTSLEERDKLDKDQYIGLCNNNLVTKRKLTSTLITFCRRSKRSKDNAANDVASECTDKCASEKPLAASCSVVMKNEKKPPEDIDNSRSFSAPAAMVMHVDNPVHFPHGTAKDAPTSVGQVFGSSHEEKSSLEEKVCMDVQDNHRINVPPPNSPNEDVNTKIVPSNLSMKRGFISLLDLSISPPASRDIDCNIPLDCDSDQIHLFGPLEVVRDSLGSTSKINKNTSASQVPCAGNGSPVRAVSDKGKFIVESSPVKNNCMQLFPENRCNETLQIANDLANTTRFLPSSLHSSHIHNLSLQSEQTVNARAAYYSSLYDWPQLQTREPFQDFLPSTSNRADSLSRHLMMLDNILTRARGKFEFPTTWSEEELDCLWIGVRRHGVNNWDAIIRDPRLHFSPWKTARNLTDRWQEEQYRLFHGGPGSQVKHTTRPDLLSNHTTGFQLSLGAQQYPFHGYGTRNRPPAAHYIDLAGNRQFQKPVNYMSGSSWGLINPSEGRGFVKGNLPHWLREAVEIPPRPPGPACNIVPSVCNPNFDCSGNSRQLWANTKNAPVRRRTEPCANSSLVIKSGTSELHECRANNKKDDLIIINSDASSEETISDDHSIRP